MEIVSIVVAQIIIFIVMLGIQNNHPISKKGYVTSGFGLEIMVVIPLLLLANSEKNVWVWVICVLPVLIGGFLFNKGLSINMKVKQDNNTSTEN